MRTPLMSIDPGDNLPPEGHEMAHSPEDVLCDRAHIPILLEGVGVQHKMPILGLTTREEDETQL